MLTTPAWSRADTGVGADPVPRLDAGRDGGADLSSTPNTISAVATWSAGDSPWLSRASVLTTSIRREPSWPPISTIDETQHESATRLSRNFLCATMLAWRRVRENVRSEWRPP